MTVTVVVKVADGFEGLGGEAEGVGGGVGAGLGEEFPEGTVLVGGGGLVGLGGTEAGDVAVGIVEDEVGLGGGVVVEDKDLTGRRLVEVVEPWLLDPASAARTAAAALSYGRPDAATNVARLVLDQLHRRPGEVSG